jgi:hypothetical protein
MEQQAETGKEPEESKGNMIVKHGSSRTRYTTAHLVPLASIPVVTDAIQLFLLSHCAKRQILETVDGC